MSPAYALIPDPIGTIVEVVLGWLVALLIILVATGFYPRAKTPEAFIRLQEYRRRWALFHWGIVVFALGFGVLKLGTIYFPIAEETRGLLNSIAEGAFLGLIVGPLSYFPLNWFYQSPFATPPTTPDIVFRQAVFTMILGWGFYSLFAEEEPGFVAWTILWVGIAGLVAMTIKRRRQWTRGLP